MGTLIHSDPASAAKPFRHQVSGEPVQGIARRQFTVIYSDLEGFAEKTALDLAVARDDPAMIAIFGGSRPG